MRIRPIGGRMSVVASALLAISLVAGGCGGGTTRSSGSPSTRVHPADFDVSFVPDSASRLVVARVGAPLTHARDVAGRMAAWPVLEPYLPTRARVLDVSLRQVGLAWDPGQQVGWMGDEVGAAQLAGEERGWLVWSSIRVGQEAAARRAGRSLLRSARRGSQVVVSMADGRLMVASTQRALAASRRAAHGSSSFERTPAWSSLTPELGRHGGMIAAYLDGRAGVIGSDDAGVWGSAVTRGSGCGSPRRSDAIAELGGRPSGAGVVLASGNRAAVDRRTLQRELVWLEGTVRRFAHGAASTPWAGATGALTEAADVLVHVRALPESGGGSPLSEDPRFVATLAAAHAPATATSAYWIDMAVLNRQVVDDLLHRRRIGETAATVARAATQGIDGALAWTELVVARGRCETHVGARLALPR